MHLQAWDQSFKARENRRIGLRLSGLAPRGANAITLFRGAFRRMAAVGRTAAFSFAGILAFAAVVAGLAAAFALTGVRAFAGVNVLFLGQLADRDASLRRRIGGMRLDRERAAH